MSSSIAVNDVAVVVGSAVSLPVFSCWHLFLWAGDDRLLQAKRLNASTQL